MGEWGGGSGYNRILIRCRERGRICPKNRGCGIQCYQKKVGIERTWKIIEGYTLQSCVGNYIWKILGCRSWHDAEAVEYIVICNMHLGKGGVQWRLCISDQGKLSRPGEWKRMIINCIFKHKYIIWQKYSGIGWRRLEMVVKCLDSSRDSMIMMKATSGGSLELRQGCVLSPFYFQYILGRQWRGWWWVSLGDYWRHKDSTVDFCR